MSFHRESGNAPHETGDFSKVWKSEASDDNTILVYIKRLCDKIEDTPSKPKHLMTVWGKGYQFFP